MTEKTNLSSELKKQLEQDPQFKLQQNDEIDLMALIAVLCFNKYGHFDKGIYSPLK